MIISLLWFQILIWGSIGISIVIMCYILGQFVFELKKNKNI